MKVGEAPKLRSPLSQEQVFSSQAIILWMFYPDLSQFLLIKKIITMIISQRRRRFRQKKKNRSIWPVIYWIRLLMWPWRQPRYRPFQEVILSRPDLSRSRDLISLIATLCKSQHRWPSRDQSPDGSSSRRWCPANTPKCQWVVQICLTTRWAWSRNSRPCRPHPRSCTRIQWCQAIRSLISISKGSRNRKEVNNRSNRSTILICIRGNDSDYLMPV